MGWEGAHKSGKEWAQLQGKPLAGLLRWVCFGGLPRGARKRAHEALGRVSGQDWLARCLQKHLSRRTNPVWAKCFAMPWHAAGIVGVGAGLHY